MHYPAKSFQRYLLNALGKMSDLQLYGSPTGQVIDELSTPPAKQSSKTN
jgi:hypothetical protein